MAFADLITLFPRTSLLRSLHPTSRGTGSEHASSRRRTKVPVNQPVMSVDWARTAYSECSHCTSVYLGAAWLLKS